MRNVLINFRFINSDYHKLIKMFLYINMNDTYDRTIRKFSITRHMNPKQNQWDAFLPRSFKWNSDLHNLETNYTNSNFKKSRTGQIWHQMERTQKRMSKLGSSNRDNLQCFQRSVHIQTKAKHVRMFVFPYLHCSLAAEFYFQNTDRNI